MGRVDIKSQPVSRVNLLAIPSPLRAWLILILVHV